MADEGLVSSQRPTSSWKSQQLDRMENTQHTDNEENEMEQGGKHVNDDQDETSGIDTTDVFHSVFQGKDKFDSWEEFITLFEQFQDLTNSVFKPRCSERVYWSNEKRKSTDQIPEKFVYSAISLICHRFGTGVRKQGSKRKRESYVGQDCEAFVKLSYKKGCLNITKYNLVHKNHSLCRDAAQMRTLRPVMFTDDLDFLVCKAAEECNVFENRIAETNWQNAVTQLTKADPKLEHLTRRRLKKRLHFLMDRYDANCGSCAPINDDEMGQILFRLLTQKETILTYVSKRGHKRKGGSTETERIPKRRGRPRKNHNVDDEDELDDEDYDDDTGGGDDRTNANASSKKNGDMSSVLNYWQEHDAEKRKMQWEKVRLRREELELQKSRFELEKKERMTLLEVLKTQSQIMEFLKNVASSQLWSSPSKISTKEYIINKDGTLQLLDHGEHKTEPVTGQGTTRTQNNNDVAQGST